MSNKEAAARIKINKLLEQAGWRFFDDDNGKANICLEANAKITQTALDALGADFETSKNGFIDFLLLDERGFPFVVLEAKKTNKDPLAGKEQARRYAQSQKVRFILLSNGDSHYFWDIKHSNPHLITEFPTLASLKHKARFVPNNQRLSDEIISDDYIALTQKPSFKDDPSFQNPATQKNYLLENGLRLLRPYQVRAIHALQQQAKTTKARFLFEMATGTGKTLTAAAVIKLFLRTGNAKRVLFLVDRLELESQAAKSFTTLLKNDYSTVIYKQNKDDWQKAEIVVSTVQSLAINDKYQTLFSPTDFDLIISDEAHRSINGNARAVFEHFVGFKLGLTATPKDYLKNTINNLTPFMVRQAHHERSQYPTERSQHPTVRPELVEGLNQKQPKQANDQRDWERRILLDTYKTFGCDNGEPTFRYSLLDGVRDNYLINPIVADARTEITTQLLSEQGYAIHLVDDNGEATEDIFEGKDFEKSFFSAATNLAFCQAFMQNALKDPLSGEIGKTIVFCVSQKHASKITQALNELAFQLYPDKYNSDFAVQVTSNVSDAQTMTINFANNKLNGYSRFLAGYKTAKTRVCVTVGMMTTGYDCADILNLCLMRPIFSPSDFVQIKGRGTRKHSFKYQDVHKQNYSKEKQRFKLFDFFANCAYFEEKFDYDEVLAIPKIASPSLGGDGTPPIASVTLNTPDALHTIMETPIGYEGMKVDRQLFQQAQQTIAADHDIKTAIENDQWDKAIATLRDKYEDQPNLYLTLEKIRASENLDRRVTWREVLERIFGYIDRFASKDEKLNSEVNKFIAIHKPDSIDIPNIRNFMKAYIADEQFRTIINAKEYAELNTYAGFSMAEFKALNNYRDEITEYVKNYVLLNQYMN